MNWPGVPGDVVKDDVRLLATRFERVESELMGNSELGVMCMAFKSTPLFFSKCGRLS